LRPVSASTLNLEAAKLVLFWYIPNWIIELDCLPAISFTRWFKYDRDKLWLVYTQSVPVIFEPPCTLTPLSFVSEFMCETPHAVTFRAQDWDHEMYRSQTQTRWNINLLEGRIAYFGGFKVGVSGVIKSSSNPCKRDGLKHFSHMKFLELTGGRAK
jgi:hypothetical protein